MAVRGGLTRFGQPVLCALSLSNWLRCYSAHPWASPLRGQRMRCSKLLPAILCRPPVVASHPPAGVQHAKKKPVLAYELFLEYGGEGGIDSLRSPFGQPVRCALSLSNWLRQWSNPGRGFSSPRRRATCEKKARTYVRALSRIWR